VYIVALTGFPRRVVSMVTVTMANQGTTQVMTTTMDFYDYGAKIHIALPNC
jgi:hypothetical protein